MLNYRTLLNVRTVKRPGPDKNDEQQYDLLTHVIKTVDVPIGDVLIVNKDYVARPDLISLAVYGDDSYGDIICKFNGISNPFEMNEGDIIAIPTYDSIRFMFNDNIAASDFIGEEKTSRQMREREYQFQKEKEEKRTPSQQLVGETNYVIDKSLGVVFY